MELKGFQRVELEAGETKTLHFTLGFDELRLLDASYHWVVEPGAFTVLECRGSAAEGGFQSSVRTGQVPRVTVWQRKVKAYRMANGGKQSACLVSALLQVKTS